DAEPEEVRAVVDSGVVTVVQLHGAEDAAYITALHRALPRTPVIKAARPAGLAEAARLGADALLVDGPRPGSGEPFDWTQLNPTRLPLILAGGLTPETAGAAARLGVTALDVSSGVETAGVKDPAKIRAFVAAARQPSGKET
ncbi:MAG: phosphoribosylanthranilate isomerase, partial [Propionibacteriaceae bacterium]|nr:phosphoribosylanthranilate isomerase [Propionibacteriaceae bacterium]